MTAFLSLARKEALQYRDLNPALSGKDTIVSLVTCENANTDGRAVLMGREQENLSDDEKKVLRKIVKSLREAERSRRR